jgi:DNA-binding response OmpR family regulator
MEERIPHWPIRGSVLVIDDDADHLKRVKGRFETHGWPCFTARSHDEALKLLHSPIKFGLVMLDWDTYPGRTRRHSYPR